MKYLLLYNGDPNGLTQEVQKYLDDDWELYGGPFTGPADNQSWFHYQAVTKS